MSPAPECIDSFWDTETSEFGLSRQGIGKTTTQMTQEATFTNWDFENVWKICEGTNYPRLMWEADTPGDIACPYGIGIEDFSALSAQWQLTKLIADIEPNGGDGIINIADLARIAAAWLSISPEDAFDQACDIAPPEGDDQITTEDITTLAEQWLQKSAHSAELADGFGDRYVDMLDWSVFASAWQSITDEPNFNQRCDLADPVGYIDTNDLAVFAAQWLMTGKTSADIAPNNINTVGYEDMEIIAENWLIGR